jgi:tetratricopeptide (TPR) repeat protein
MSALFMLALWMAAPAQASGGPTLAALTAHCYSNRADSIDACTQALDKARTSREQSRILLAKGMLQTNAKEYAIGAALFQQAIRLAPQDPSGHVVYGWALEAAGDHPNADVQCLQAVQLGLRHASELRLDPTIQALIESMGGGANFDFAVARGLERIGENAVAKSFYLEAASAFEKGANPLVIEAFDGAIRVDATDAETHIRLAHFWKRWDDRHSAEVVHQLEEAAQLDPSNAETHFELAHAYIDKGESARAIPELQAAVQYRPDFAEAKHDLQLAVLTTGQASAQVAEGVDAPAAKQQLRLCIDLDGIRSETACRAALKIGLSSHNAAAAHTFLAQNLAEEAAASEYHAAIEADPTYALTYLLFAHSREDSPETSGAEDAAELFTNAAKLRPEWIVPRERLASLLWKRKRYEEAIAQQREATALDPDDNGLTGRLKTWQDDYALFKEQFRQASAEVQAKPDNVFAQQHYAAAAAAMGKKAEARNAYRAVYKMDPSAGWKLASSLLYTDLADVACAIYPAIRVTDKQESGSQALLEADLATCAQKFPRDLLALKRLAELQAQAGDMQAARATYEQMLQRDGAYFDDHPDDRVLYDRTVVKR